MADEQPDPLVALLDKSGLSTAQKRGLWDLYTAAKDTGDLQKRLDSLQLPNAIKHDLWNLKDSEGDRASFDDVPTEPTATKPSEGYWEDRGIGGKVWHPASGVKEGQRADVQVLGVPPELAALSGFSVGRAALAPGLKLAGRAASAGVAAAGQVAPIIGYEAARQGLKYAGVPEPLASAGAALATGAVLRGKGAARAAEAEAPAAVERTPLGFPKTAPQLSPRELTEKLRTEWRTSRGLPAEGYKPTVDPEVVKQEFKTFFDSVRAAKIHYTAPETALGMKLLKGGLKAPEVEATILELRKMPVSWRTLPTDAEVAAIIAARAK